jgi:hypothetical protein
MSITAVMFLFWSSYGDIHLENLLHGKMSTKHHQK